MYRITGTKILYGVAAVIFFATYSTLRHKAGDQLVDNYVKQFEGDVVLDDRTQNVPEAYQREDLKPPLEAPADVIEEFKSVSSSSEEEIDVEKEQEKEKDNDYSDAENTAQIVCEDEHRKQMFDEFCTQNTDRTRLQTLQMLKAKTNFQLTVHEETKTLYCFNNKAGCSSLKRIFRRISAIYNNNVTFWDAFHPLNTYDIPDIERIIENYRKVVLVRHPMDRFVSSYWYTIISDEDGNGNSTFGKHGKHFKDLTFREFLKYAMEDPDARNPHWKTYQDCCLPCLVNYDIIAKVETFDLDVPKMFPNVDLDKLEVHTIRKANVGTQRKKDRYQTEGKERPRGSDYLMFYNETDVTNVKSPWQPKYLKEFAEADKEDMEKFVKKYRDDIEMFDYHWGFDATAKCGGDCC